MKQDLEAIQVKLDIIESMVELLHQSVATENKTYTDALYGISLMLKDVSKCLFSVK